MQKKPWIVFTTKNCSYEVSQIGRSKTFLRYSAPCILYFYFIFVTFLFVSGCWECRLLVLCSEPSYHPKHDLQYLKKNSNILIAMQSTIMDLGLQKNISDPCQGRKGESNIKQFIFFDSFSIEKTYSSYP